VYTTCLFCHADLGRNEVLESFPVGRRLAYDADKGRLWVVCRRCERWNLTPQEERWEAIELAERLYRDTRLRASTDNVGLARLKDGTELVRVGRPLRAEFAAWRYGDQFGRRRRRQLLIAGGALVALGGVVVGGVFAGVAVTGFGGVIGQGVTRIVNGSPDAVVARVPTAREVLHVKRKHLPRTSIVGSDAGPFGLLFRRPKRGDVLLEGDDATRAAGLLFPATNRFGGSRAAVARAVAAIEAAGGSEGLIAGFANAGGRSDAATAPGAVGFRRLQARGRARRARRGHAPVDRDGAPRGAGAAGDAGRARAARARVARGGRDRRHRRRPAPPRRAGRAAGSAQGVARRPQ
jgi:hypothetical protein